MACLGTNPYGYLPSVTAMHAKFLARGACNAFRRLASEIAVTRVAGASTAVDRSNGHAPTGVEP